MHRRIAPLLIAVVIAASFATPASAATPNAAQPVASTVSAPEVGGRPDTTDQYIVMLKNGSDTTAVVEKARKRDGVKADQTYEKAIRGFAAKLDNHQKSDLLADPNVVAIVPDEVVELTSQTVPTGVSRIGGRLNPIAKINGIDERVDADVAIIDTGISSHPDLNIGGGYNCTSSDRTAWQDGNHHGTHVAGTIGALDNGFGVVGVAPGARVWGVRILNNDGYGLISWYICGLNWVLAQRDPSDATRPLFEAVNMSVTKAGTDDHNCGLTNNDPLHQAICRVVAGGITVVAAAGNEKHNAAANIPASYDEVITVSALADSDGKPGGLNGNHCANWGLYDKDDTFADFSNYGGDVDIIAPGKCILSTWPGNTYVYLAGTSMAAPHVTGAVALYKSTRPNATPAEVREALRYLGNLNWNTATDPDTAHEPLLDVSRIGALGTFALTPGAGIGSVAIPAVAGGKTVSVPVTIVRGASFFERVRLSVSSLPAGWTASLAPTSLMGWSSNVGAVSLVAPTDAPDGIYEIGVSGSNQGRTIATTLSVRVVNAPPVAQPPTVAFIAGSTMGLSSIQARVSWPAAVDQTTYIAGYEVEVSENGGPWKLTTARGAAQREAVYTLAFDTGYRFRVRAMAANLNWSPWAEATAETRIAAFDDRNPAVLRSASWLRSANASAWHQTETTSSSTNAKLRFTFTGQAIAVVAPRSPSRGKAKIYLDGALVATIYLSAPVRQVRRVDFARSFATPGTHRIEFVVVGTGTHPLIGLDAFVVSR